MKDKDIADISIPEPEFGYSFKYVRPFMRVRNANHHGSGGYALTSEEVKALGNVGDISKAGRLRSIHLKGDTAHIYYLAPTGTNDAGGFIFKPKSQKFRGIDNFLQLKGFSDMTPVGMRLDVFPERKVVEPK